MSDPVEIKSSAEEDSSILGGIRHELSAALASINSGFKHLSSAQAQSREKAKKVHQNGVKRLSEILAKIDKLTNPSTKSKAVAESSR